MAGLGFLLRHELAARIELAVVLIALVWFALLGRSLGEILILLVLACLLFSIEALNTAIECIVDRLSPERSAFGKAAKDLGSAAVFFVLLAGGLYVGAITADHFNLVSL